MVPLRRRSFPTAVCGLLLLACGCAGYQVGNRSLYRPDIRTVYVPMIESDSWRRTLGEQLTEAVVKEIELKTPYKVISDPNRADSILTGRIISERKYLLVETETDEPRDVQTDLMVVMTWLDRQGFPVLQSPTSSLNQQGFSVQQVANYVPEAGQSVTVAHQEALAQIATQVVSQMESPW